MQHKLGIIGLGGMSGGYHLDTCAREDVPMTATAAYDIRPERREYARSKGLTAFDTVEEFLDSHLFDTVLVATPNNYHKPMVIKSLEAGYNTMTEKPAAMSSADFREMMAAGEKSGKLFTVHQNRRWDRDFMVMKEIVENGDVGKPYLIESRIQGTGATMTGWRSQPDHGGGMLLDWGVHLLDQICWMYKDTAIDNVYANVRTFHTDLCDDYARVNIAFKNGVNAVVEVANFALAPLPRFNVYGDMGGLVVEGWGKGKVIHAKNGKWTPYDCTVYGDQYVGGFTTRPERQYTYEKEEYEAPKELPAQDWASLYKNLCGALDGTEEICVKPEQVLRVLQVIEAADESQKTGTAVKMDV